MTFPTHVMQVVGVRLTQEAGRKLSHLAYGQAENWLKHWTPRGTFKAVLGESREDCLDKCRKQMQTLLVPSWLTSESEIFPKYFEFEVSDQKIEDGMFWMDSSVVWCQWHKVVES
ncbi:hypothetical protein [Ferribacterium limneticum]|uniref:hypothetical protein n=1 Tax=Ferribacterium limneticum TaxID=76259 RepID=UPI001CF88F68|nr:hypothetical protein [Ferribacterium limneticum]UCV26750.1 hypothetical protein KI617_10555 [Ferribacterium limneticum]UCV30667.1 hypothetical protein KI608_10555 [Ferribacterium limneticum]